MPCLLRILHGSINSVGVVVDVEVELGPRLSTSVATLMKKQRARGRKTPDVYDQTVFCPSLSVLPSVW